MFCRPSSEELLNSVKEGAEVLDANVINNGMLIWEFVLFCNSIQKASSKSHIVGTSFPFLPLYKEGGVSFWNFRKISNGGGEGCIFASFLLVLFMFPRSNLVLQHLINRHDFYKWIIFEKKRHSGKEIFDISELFIKFNKDSCFELITGGVSIYLSGCV